MRDDQHIVCLGQSADLFAGGNTAHSTDVRADILAGVAGHQHLKLTQVNGALARGDGHPHLAGYFSHGIHVIRRDGVLQNHGAIGLHGTAKGHRLGQGHTAVHFQHEVKVRADRLAGHADFLHLPLNAAGEELPLAVRRAGGAVAEDLGGRKAHLLQLLVLFGQLLLILGEVHDRGVHPYFFTGLSAQQLIHGHTQGLALDIPQSDIDGRDGTHDDRTAEVDRTQEVLVVILNAERVFANEIGGKFFNGGSRGLQIAPVACFAQTHDACIGIHLHEQVVLGKAKLDVGNFHKFNLQFLLRSGFKSMIDVPGRTGYVF